MKNQSQTPPKSPRSPKAAQSQSGTPKKSEQPCCTYMTESRIQECTQLLTSSFIYMNPMWKKMGAKYEEVYSVVRGRMIACCRSGVSFVLINPSNNALIGVNYSVDMKDHLETKVMPHHSEFLKVLGKYAHELEDEIFQKLRPTLKKGVIMYCHGGAIDPRYASKGISKKFWSLCFAYARTAGYKTIYTRSTNRITTHVFHQFGAKTIKTVQITEPGVKDQYLELIKIQMQDLTFDTLTKYFQDKHDDDDEMNH